MKTETSDWFGMNKRDRGAFVVGKPKTSLAEDFEYDLGAWGGGGAAAIKRGLFRSRSAGRFRSRSVGGSGSDNDDEDDENDYDAVSQARGAGAGGFIRGRPVARKSRKSSGKRKRPHRAKSQPAVLIAQLLAAAKKREAALQMLPNRVHGTIFASKGSGPVIGGEAVHSVRAPNPKARRNFDLPFGGCCSGAIFSSLLARACTAASVV